MTIKMHKAKKSGSNAPERGDIVLLAFDPQKGKEIQKTRPALTLSPKQYNQKTGLGLFAPITSSIKGYPFEIPVEDPKIDGVILADQVKSFDWQALKARKIGQLRGEPLETVLTMVRLLLQ